LKKILIIQTASIGDVILVASLLEKLHQFYPDAQIDVLVKDGNQQLFKGHPYLHQLFVWVKKEHKYKNLLALIAEIRAQKYDYVVNVQRFASSGVLTMFSGAKRKIGFRKNPLSLFFSKSFEHHISSKLGSPHELERNHQLIRDITDSEIAPTRLYPSQHDDAFVSGYKTVSFVCIAPTSLWFTKQFPVERWIELIKILPDDYTIYLLGAKNDNDICQRMIREAGRANMMSLCGKLTLLESAALMKDAQMNYVNDSAPLHLACAVNAPVTAVFCSTVPEFGFGPRTPNSKVVQIEEQLSCRPCGLHGHNSCPEKHFKCAYSISLEKMVL
jgi:ADP-heptose:LPS heptosyltransferase